MQKHRVKVQVLIALACATWSALAVGTELDDAVVSGDETPYVDAEGNVDTELAKEYAERVDNYVDEFGTEWDVWLDEYGGQMWAESVGGEGTLGLVIHLMFPYSVTVWRDDLSPTQVTYTIAGSYYGWIEYGGTDCYGGLARCSRWNLFAADHDPGCDEPDNAYQIEAYARSTASFNFCDAYYDGRYHPPGTSGWIEDEEDCGAISGGYEYYIFGDSGFVMSGGNFTYDWDDEDDDHMVRWRYRTGGYYYYVEVHYGGCPPA
ncbi:MAG: hypothetical protein M0R80_16065 [Proteobacteria bacterium]|jgi:hypothetical protein|nr:hypothetical protein [Pseudomonadota bacterium]